MKMMFTSDDLPLTNVTPVTTGSDSDATSPSLMSDTPVVHTKSLLSSVPTILFLLKTVFTSRATAGDEWIQMAGMSHNAIDMHYIVANAPLPTATDSLSPFHAPLYEASLFHVATAFDLPFTTTSNLHTLMDNLVMCEDISPSVLVTAFLYVDRAIEGNPHLFLTTSNAYLLFSVALMLAVKFNEDDYFSQEYFSNLIGVAPKQLATLEREFLCALSHKLFIRPAQFANAEIALMAEALDSAECAPVLSHLQSCNFTNFDAAVCRAQDWAASRPIPQRVGPCSWWWSGTVASANHHNHAANAPRTRTIVGQLATAQLRRDLDVPRGVDPTGAELLARTRQLTDRGAHRVYALLQLAHGSDAPTALPSLERVAVEAHSTTQARHSLSTSIWAGSGGQESWNGWDRQQQSASIGSEYAGKTPLGNRRVQRYSMPSGCLPSQAAAMALTTGTWTTENCGSSTTSSTTTGHQGMNSRSQSQVADMHGWSDSHGSEMSADRSNPNIWQHEGGSTGLVDSWGDGPRKWGDWNTRKGSESECSAQTVYSLGPSMWNTTQVASQEWIKSPSAWRREDQMRVAGKSAQADGGTNKVWGRGWSREMHEVSTRSRVHAAPMGPGMVDCWAGM